MKYLILGGGPAGLAFASMLVQMGETNFLVLEKENEAGGLCRSKMIDGSPLDIGGGHFLDVVRPDVSNFLFSFLPENEWNLFNRSGLSTPVLQPAAAIDFRYSICLSMSNSQIFASKG